MMAKTFFTVILGSIFFSMVIPAWAQIDWSVLEPYRGQRGPAGGDTGTRGPSERDLRYYQLENRAYTRSQEGKWDDALPLYQELARARGSSDDYFNLGAVLVNLGRYGEAEQAFDQIGFFSRNLKINGLHSLHWAKGRALLGRGPYADAEKEFREVIRLKPDDAGAWNNLGVALLAQGKLVEAEDAFRQAYSLDPAEDIKGNIATVLRRQDEARNKEARLRMERASQAGKEAVQQAFQETRNNLMSAMHTNTSVVDARVTPWGAELLRRVPELERSPAADRIRKGYQAVMTHDWPVALAWWQEALQRDPNNEALKRSVELARWMVDRRREAASRPVTSFDAAVQAASRGDSQETNRLIEQEIQKIAALNAESGRLQAQFSEFYREFVDKLAVEQGRQLAAEREWEAKMKAFYEKAVEKISMPAQVASINSASMAEMAAQGERALSTQLFEDGMNFLSIGDIKQAMESFREAEFYYMFDGGQPFSASLSTGTPTSPPREQTRLDFIP